jgi:hypothetical protein
MAQLDPAIAPFKGCPTFRERPSRSGENSRVESAYCVLGMIDLLLPSITKEVVARRFGPNKKIQRDMLGSFIAHGLNQEEAESETILQM